MGEARWPLRAWLLASLILISALLPPELGPAGLFLTTVLAAGLGIDLIASTDGKSTVRSESRTAGLVLGAYLVLSVLHSDSPYRSLAFVSGVVPAWLAFRVARRGARKVIDENAIVLPLLATGAVVSGWALYQASFGLERMARELRGLGRMELDPAVLRAESGRAFAGFLLPSALGIFLAMTLPLAVRLLLHREPTSRRIRILAGALAGFQVLGIAASRSYGSLAALIVGGWILVPPGRRWGRARIVAALGAAAAGAFFFFQRGGEGFSPLTLRIGNWIGAGRIFLRSPLLGVGFGNFPDAYARQMTAGMNETAYAHNSYLQAAAEGGVLAFLGTIVGATVLVVHLRKAVRESPDSARAFLAALGPAAFLVHNLFDFSACLPSLLIPFAAILGLSPSRTIPLRGRGAAPEPGRRAQTAGMLLLLLGWTVWEFRDARTGALLDEGRTRLAEGEWSAARTALVSAARRNPEHPDPPAFLAEIFLPRLPDHPEERAEGERWARLAVRLRPEKALGHYLLGQYRFAAGDPGEAYLEFSRARTLFPAKPIYREELERLRQYVVSMPGSPSR